MTKKDPNKYMRPVEPNFFEKVLAKADKAMQERLAKMQPNQKVPA